MNQTVKVREYLSSASARPIETLQIENCFLSMKSPGCSNTPLPVTMLLLCPKTQSSLYTLNFAHMPFSYFGTNLFRLAMSVYFVVTGLRRSGAICLGIHIIGSFWCPMNQHHSTEPYLGNLVSRRTLVHLIISITGFGQKIPVLLICSLPNRSCTTDLLELDQMTASSWYYRPQNNRRWHGKLVTNNRCFWTLPSEFAQLRFLLASQWV